MILLEKPTPSKMKKTYIILAFTLALNSCTTIYFKQPQPQSNAALKNFPLEFQGAYIPQEENNQDTVYIMADKIIYPETYENFLPVSSLDSMVNIRIVGDSLYNSLIPIKHGIAFTITNDTLHYRLETKISMRLSDTLIIKKEGKYLVFNEKESGTEYWNVYLIEKLENENLRVLATGNFKTKEHFNSKQKYDGNLKDFYGITNFVELDTTKYLIDPTVDEFRKLVKKGLFVEAQVYLKISNGGSH